MFKNLIYIFLLIMGISLNAQVVTETVQVLGDCEMCKERIENAVREMPSAKGVWDMETKELKVTYSSETTTLDAILKNVAKAGHDNELYRAEDEVYENLASCCLYDRSLIEYVDSRPQTHTDRVRVRGNCEHCKENIEKAVHEMPSASGTWDMDSKILTVTYSPKETSLDAIMQKVAAVGYDNELYLADDKVYKGLTPCCHYDRDAAWEDLAGMEDFQYVEEDFFEDFEDLEVGLESITIQNQAAAAALDRKAAGLQLNISDKELMKAACCNLSESFETNATVDVSYSNAVSGTRQLKMLGLDQKYVLLTKELLPEIRGISSAYGLQFIPGKWIEGIQLVKGAGSVTNGYESIVGHINTELYKSATEPKNSLNFYGDVSTRFEGNFVQVSKLNENWNQSVLLSANATTSRQDHNDDGFMDQPIGRGINISYLLNYDNLNVSGLATHFGINYVNDHRLGGEMDFVEKFDRGTSNRYGIGIDIRRFQFWNKTGYIFPDKPYQSIGWMNQFTYHEQESYFGLRNYDANQKTFYSNLIFESIFGHTGHKYKAGLSFLYDHYDELYNLMRFKRNETVPGAFFEYTYTGTKLTAVAGVRADFHNLAGTQFSPRLHLKYELSPKTILRGSIGSGFRTANVFAESQAFMASNRTISILEDGGDIYGLKPETAWNYGVSLQQEFNFLGRKSTLTADFFRTDFQNQVVMDLDNSPQSLLFYNLDGKSYANSFQVQWDAQPVRRFETRLAYKFYDTQTDYLSGSKELPFTARHRGFLNLAYSTLKTFEGRDWSFDTTLQWVGKQRLPDTSTNPQEFQLPEYGKAHFLLSAQVSRNFNKNIRLYIGGDNLLSYKQENPILDVQNPFGNYFDGGMVYAPIMPANFYIGLDIEF